MKKLLGFIAVLLLSLSIHSQSTVAKIKYEQAEEAYNKGEFKTTLIRLEEAEKLLGEVNPRIMYLRIMAGKALVDKGNYSYGLLDSLRRHAAFYLKNYESNTSSEDKYREIYYLNEQLDKLPANLADYALLQKQWMEADNKKKAEEIAYHEAIKRAKQFIDSLCKVHKFLPGATVQEFKAYNPEAASALTKAYNEHWNGRPVNFFSGRPKEGPLGFYKSIYGSVERVDSFTVIVEVVGKKYNKEALLKKWKDFVYNNIPSGLIEFKTFKELYEPDAIITVRESESIPASIKISLWPFIGRIELTFSSTLTNRAKD